MTKLLNGFEDSFSCRNFPFSLSCWCQLHAPQAGALCNEESTGLTCLSLSAPGSIPRTAVCHQYPTPTGSHLSSRHFPFLREPGAPPSLPPILILTCALVLPQPASMPGPPSARPPCMQYSCIDMCPTGEEMWSLQLACVSSHVERRDQS